MTENGDTLRRTNVPRVNSYDDMEIGESGNRYRQLVDAGVAGESTETTGTADIRGRISASPFTDAGDIGEDSGHGQFFAGGDRHNVGLYPGATESVEGQLDDIRPSRGSVLSAVIPFDAG